MNKVYGTLKDTVPLNENIAKAYDSLMGLDGLTNETKRVESQEAFKEFQGIREKVGDNVLFRDEVTHSTKGVYFVSKIKKDDVDSLVDNITARAETVDYSKKFNKENWDKELGNAVFHTPIGDVALGEHQYQKLIEKKRTKDWMMIKPTLESPSLILSEINENGEETGCYNFIKVFDADGVNKWFYSAVVTKKGEGLFSVSNRRTDKRQVKKDLKKY